MPLYGFDPRTPLEIHLDWQERVTVRFFFENNNYSLFDIIIHILSSVGVFL